jgi:hypothetical protein
LGGFQLGQTLGGPTRIDSGPSSSAVSERTFSISTLCNSNGFGVFFGLAAVMDEGPFIHSVVFDSNGGLGTFAVKTPSPMAQN